MESILENKLISSKDIELNLNKWKKKKDCNILYVTGLSGSGKSTLAKEYAKKYKAIWIELDLIERNHLVKTDKNPDECNKILKGILDKYGYPDTDNLSWVGRQRYFNDILELLIDYCNKHTDRLFVFEGVQVYSFIDYKVLEGKPLIVKGTSALKSSYQATVRDYDGLENLLKNLSYNHAVSMKSFYNWEKEEDVHLSKFKKQVLTKESFCLPKEHEEFLLEALFNNEN